MKIEFSNEELEVMVKLLDAAVKSLGLPAVEATAVLYNKIKMSVDAENKKTEAKSKAKVEKDVEEVEEWEYPDE